MKQFWQLTYTTIHLGVLEAFGFQFPNVPQTRGGGKELHTFSAPLQISEPDPYGILEPETAVVHLRGMTPDCLPKMCYVEAYENAHHQLEIQVRGGEMPEDFGVAGFVPLHTFIIETLDWWGAKLSIPVEEIETAVDMSAKQFMDRNFSLEEIGGMFHISASEVITFWYSDWKIKALRKL